MDQKRVSKVSQCRGCPAQIRWVNMQTGKAMPVDAEPIKVIIEEGRMISAYVPHWATCPKAKEFKK